MDRYLTPSAVIVVFRRKVGENYQYLMQKRQNTGFADGLWDFSCSGHVEKGESMLSTCIRECKEELGVQVNADDLHFLTFIHKNDGGVVYYNAYFYVDDFVGEPKICESDKCEQLEWFFADQIPYNTIKDRLVAFKSFDNGQKYIEFGWEK